MHEFVLHFVLCRPHRATNEQMKVCFWIQFRCRRRCRSWLVSRTITRRTSTSKRQSSRICLSAFTTATTDALMTLSLTSPIGITFGSM